MRRILAILLFFSMSVCPLKAREVIVISTQSDFDKISETIASAVKKADRDIYITIAPGRYVVKDNGFRMNKLAAAGKNLHIVGNGTILIPEGHQYRNGDKYEGVFSPDNSWMSGKTDYSVWSHVRYADGLVEVMNEKTQLCRLKSKESLREGLDVSNAYILLTHWYQSSVYRITKIENGYIYFVATDLKKGYRKGYNVNDDFNVAGLYPRYKLCNLETGEDNLRIVNGRILLPRGVPSVWEGTSNRIYSVNYSKFKSLEITGIAFYGNSNVKESFGISIAEDECDYVRIHHCEFRGFHSRVFYVASNNVTFEKNVFSDCYESGINSYNCSERTVVRGNSFYMMGKRMNNSFCVSCHGPEFVVENNTFLDFGFDGIGAGESHSNHPERKSYGVIQNNTLSYSKEYLADIANYTIMDSGAIYLRTRNDGVVIRNNYIHDITGMYENRGIYCDNGAYGYSLIGNVVTGITNSNCLASRRDASGEESRTPGSGIVATNVNNVVMNNVVDGRIQFVGNETPENGCVFSNNYILLEEGERMPVHSIKNIKDEEKLIVLDHTGEKRGRIGLSLASYKALKKNPEWKRIKGFVIRKRR